jgi:hypothetical protein
MEIGDEGYEIYKSVGGRKMVLVWWNPDDCQDVQLPTIRELLDEGAKICNHIMELNVPQNGSSN